MYVCSYGVRRLGCLSWAQTRAGLANKSPIELPWIHYHIWQPRRRRTLQGGKTLQINCWSREDDWEEGPIEAIIISEAGFYKYLNVHQQHQLKVADAPAARSASARNSTETEQTDSSIRSALFDSGLLLLLQVVNFLPSEINICLRWAVNVETPAGHQDVKKSIQSQRNIGPSATNLVYLLINGQFIGIVWYSCSNVTSDPFWRIFAKVSFRHSPKLAFSTPRILCREQHRARVGVPPRHAEVKRPTRCKHTKTGVLAGTGNFSNSIAPGK